MRLEKRCRACLVEWDHIWSLEAQLQTLKGSNQGAIRRTCFEKLAKAYRAVDTCNCSKKLDPLQFEAEEAVPLPFGTR